jgi:hypothetical protein
MGLIRKTLSVGTLGIVSFRSKKEKLQRAEQSRHDAETALEREHAARVSAEAISIAAQKRAKRAKAEGAHDERKRARKAKRRGRHGHTTDQLAERGRKVSRGAQKAAKLAAIEAKIAAKRSAIEAKEAAKRGRKLSSETAERGRKAGRRARKVAQHSAAEVKHAAERTLQHASEAVSS